MASKTWCRLLISVFLLFTVAEFVVRGPLRVATDGMQWNDFMSPYIQAKAWLLGKNPYRTDELLKLWPTDNLRPLFVDRDAAAGLLEKKRGIPSPYPPLTLVLLSPFAKLSWTSAMRVWIVVNVAALLASLLALLSICGVSWHDPRGQLFLASAFALAPIQTGIATANPAILAVALTVATVWAAHVHRNYTSGILLALAICLKPPLGLCLIVYYLIRGHWKIVSVAAATTALVTGVAIMRLTWTGVAWLPAYRENATAIFGPGALDDFSPADPARLNMINLQVLFSSLWAGRSLANALALGCGAFLAGVWLWLCIKQRRHELLEIGTIFVLSLLPVYHRFYDAALLIWPMCWSILVVTKRSVTLLTIALILPFFIPGAALLDRLAQGQKLLPAAVLDGWWWNLVVMPHEVWDVLFLSVLLLYFMSLQPARDFDKR